MRQAHHRSPIFLAVDVPATETGANEYLGPQNKYSVVVSGSNERSVLTAPVELIDSNGTREVNPRVVIPRKDAGKVFGMEIDWIVVSKCKDIFKRV